MSPSILAYEDNIQDATAGITAGIREIPADSLRTIPRTKSAGVSIGSPMKTPADFVRGMTKIVFTSIRSTVISKYA